MKLYSRVSCVSCVQKRQTCKFSFVPEGGKGGAAAAAERGVDPSRLDLRIGKILTAKKVSMSGYLPTVGKYSREWISLSLYIADKSVPFEFGTALLITFKT